MAAMTRYSVRGGQLRSCDGWASDRTRTFMMSRRSWFAGLSRAIQELLIDNTARLGFALKLAHFHKSQAGLHLALLQRIEALASDPIGLRAE